MLAALVLQIYLERIGFDLVSLGRDLFSGKAPQLRTAGPWWAIAGLAFIVGGATARRAQPPPPAVAAISPAALGGRRRIVLAARAISAIRRAAPQGVGRGGHAGGEPGARSAWRR